MTRIVPIERHPWPPYIPDKPRILMLGTFPPQRVRWSMDFFFPNRMNDMWRLMGLIFGNDRDLLCDERSGGFNLDAIKTLLNEHGIALWDTAMAVRRLRDNASDKYLEIVEPIDLVRLLAENDTITTIATAGEKATGVVASIAGCDPPLMGECVECEVGGSKLALWRMPSSSRAYPLSLEKKAEYYRKMFLLSGVLNK